MSDTKTAVVTKAVANEVEFVVDKSYVGNPNSKQEQERLRYARIESILKAAPLTFVCPLGSVNAHRLVTEHKVLIFGKSRLTIELPKSLGCVLCEGIHGRPTANRPEWDESLLAKMLVFTQNGSAILVSESCVPKYVLRYATAQNVTNFSELITAFGPYKAPSKK